MVLAGATLIAALAVGVVSFESRGRDADDSLLSPAEERAIVDLLARHQAGCGSCYAVPRGALATVERRLARLSRQGARPVEEGEKHRQVLPDAAMKTLNARHRRYLESTCTMRYAAEESSLDWATLIDDSLYNNPDYPPPAGTESNILALECKQRSGGWCLVWALVWSGDLTVRGRGIQVWGVYEYPVLFEEGEWRVDDESLIASMLATSSTSWGPDAPHDSIDDCCQELSSTLYPRQPIPRSELLSLEAHVVK